MYKKAGPNVRAPKPVGAFSLMPFLSLLGSLLVASAVATQWEAHALNAQFANAAERLGPCWFGGGALCIYRPFSWATWVYGYNYQAPHTFQIGTIIVISGTAGLFAISLIARAVWRARAAHRATTHGSARWAEPAEYRKADFHARDGVILGLSPQGEYLRDNSETHVAVIAPTGAGKGVGIVIPTLLNWTQSAFIYDFKGQNWAASAGWRSKFSNAIYFSPTDPAKSAHWNPLLEVRSDENQIRDVQNIADQIVDPQGNGKESHWDKTADMFFLGVILHVLHAEPDKSLYGVSKFLSDPSRPFEETLERMKETPHANPMAHERIAMAAQGMINKSEEERSGVLSTALAFLGLYSDPIIARNTQDSDFRILDLMEAKHPLSLYLIVPESDRLRLKPFTRLMITMMTQRLVEKLEPKKKHELLMMIDEFPRLGRMHFFADAVCFLRDYGIKVVLVAQSLMQLEDTENYARGANGVSDCRTLIVMAPQDARTAEWISEKLGTSTEVHQQTTYTGHRWAFWLGHVMVADQESARPLLDPAEVSKLPASDQIIIKTGFSPFYAKKLRYYEIPELRRRSSIAPPPLTGARPYPWRPQPRSNPWNAVVSTDHAAASPADARARAGATPQQRLGVPRAAPTAQSDWVLDGTAQDRPVNQSTDSERGAQEQSLRRQALDDAQRKPRRRQRGAPI